MLSPDQESGATGFFDGTPGQQELPPYTLGVSGNAYFSQKELLKSAAAELQKFRERGYRKADIDDAAFQMRSAYLQAGFAFAAVDYTYEQQDGHVQVDFRVEEGARVFVERINFRGNREIPSSRLLGFFRQLSGPLSKQMKMVYNESEVRDALSGIREYYRGEGYVDAVVNAPELAFTADRSGVIATIEIEEGAKYYIAEVVLRGDLIPELAPELETIKKEFTGKTYYVRRKLLLRTSLEAVYDAIGYADAGFEVTAVPFANPGRITLAAEIASGEKARISEVVIQGNAGTRDSFIRDRVKLKAGDIYSEAKRRESFRGLFESGLFAGINIERTPRQEDGGKNLLVTVEELPTREVYLEPGWGSYEELRLGVGASEKNLFGTGKNGRVEGLVSTKGGNLTASYTDPWLLQSDIAMNVPLYYERREEPSYTSEEKGLSLFFSRKFSESLTLATGYQYKIIQLYDLSDDTVIQREGEDYNKGTVGIQAVRDTRDDIFFPGKGSRLAWNLDLSLPAFGSQIEFGRITLGGRHFMELPNEYIFGLRASTGLIIPLGSQSFIPISERFFNGGDSTVRSYKHSQLGPKDENSEPLGGLGNNVASIELRKRVYRNFAATLYVDGGNVSPNRSLQGKDYTSYTNRSDLLDDTLADFFSEFKFGIGIGFQYLLPVGPIRIDIAYNPDPEEIWAEDEWVFHFSLGMAF
ncbi:MAG: outer membrane protein assembly factor BamA [Proteobacteria bacterium]|nr:outer membrane protein assembly factor BamA [Pseudomonadota bacterium]MBU1736949.1 outer membrane protein assembly factor BamA [Pseudomonadota bacterium]